MGATGDQRRRLIQAKNAAFHRLYQADVEISKRRKRGPVPLSWWERRRELAADYTRALEALACPVRQADMHQTGNDLGKNRG